MTWRVAPSEPGAGVAAAAAAMRADPASPPVESRKTIAAAAFLLVRRVDVAMGCPSGSGELDESTSAEAGGFHPGAAREPVRPRPRVRLIELLGGREARSALMWAIRRTPGTLSAVGE